MSRIPPAPRRHGRREKLPVRLVGGPSQPHDGETLGVGLVGVNGCRVCSEVCGVVRLHERRDIADTLDELRAMLPSGLTRRNSIAGAPAGELETWD